MKPTCLPVLLAAAAAAASTRDALAVSALQSVTDRLRSQLQRTALPCEPNTFSFSTSENVTRHLVPATRSALQDLIDFAEANHKPLLVRVCPGTEVVFGLPLRIGASLVSIECLIKWAPGFTGFTDYTTTGLALAPAQDSMCIFSGGDVTGHLVQVRRARRPRSVSKLKTECLFSFLQLAGRRRRAGQHLLLQGGCN